MSRVSIHDFALTMKQMSNRVQGVIGINLFVESQSIMNDIRKRAPIDSGTYSKGWRLQRTARSGDTIAATKIENRTPYGIYLEEGAEPGQAPWYYPKGKRKSQKLIVRNNRVWAGGKSPMGHVFEKGVGGAINLTIYYNNKRKKELARTLADRIIGLL